MRRSEVYLYVVIIWASFLLFQQTSRLQGGEVALVEGNPAERSGGSAPHPAAPLNDPPLVHLVGEVCVA